ncbi:MAG: hypothetical protein PHS57_06280 [Alphaproteobacteria bacterium]|nr:hypothetical protein [Alphaproteobacteria bacterium]
MNKTQRVYAVAKAHYEALKSALDRLELDYCKAHGYTTESGELAVAIYMIASEEVFGQATEDFCRIYRQETDEMVAAQIALHVVEDALIDWGLSVMPPHLVREREFLRDKGKRDYATRQKLIGLAFRMDPRTVPAAARR